MKTAMKKVIQLIVILFVVTSAAMANNYLPSVTLKGIPAEKKFSLTIEGMSEREKVSITLSNEDGQVLLQEEAKGKKEFAKVFNLKQLPAGEYFLTVSTNLRKSVQPITLTSGEVLVNPDKRREFYSPVISVGGSEYVDVSLFNGRIANITVNIRNHGSELVFQEKLENVLVVEKRYRLDKLPWGQYTIEVITPDDTYYKTFNVR